MKSNLAISRLACIVALTIAGAALVFALYGCESSDEASQDLAPVKIGTMPTEDMLPAWVAEKDGVFADEGIDVEIESFDSASALSAAIASGDVDMAMVDVMRAVKLCESGTSVDLEWVTLGTEADQGAFGVLAPAEASYSNLSELADAASSGELAGGVGVAANTVPEYVYDKLLEEAGIGADVIPTTEVASLPERYSLLMSGNLAAAALPGSLLELGVANGLKLLADDTAGENLSCSVMIARSDFAADHMEEIMKVAKAWDIAVDSISSDPGAYAALLAEKANINSAIADTYPISDYPYALDGDSLAHPESGLVEPQIEWMLEKGYLTKDASYDQADGTVSFD